MSNKPKVSNSIPFTQADKQIKVLTRIVRQGKAKSPAKVKGKIAEIKRRRRVGDWLGM